MTDELPGVPLRVAVAGASVEAVTDAEGYFLAHLRPDPADLAGPGPAAPSSSVASTAGSPPRTPRSSRCGFPDPDARFGDLSDIDDTILETGVQRVGQMIRRTLTGSALTRTPFPGAPDLYRDLAAAA